MILPGPLRGFPQGAKHAWERGQILEGPDMPKLRIAKRRRRLAMAAPEGNDLRAAKLKAMKRNKAKRLRGL